MKIYEIIFYDASIVYVHMLHTHKHTNVLNYMSIFLYENI